MESTLTPEKVEELAGGIQEATKILKDGREEMAVANKKVGELLEQQKKLEKSSGTNGEAIKQTETKLSELASKMETLANAHTDLTNKIRQQMKAVGSDGGDERGAFVYRHPRSKGAIFQSRREALELGMYFMATMKRDTSAKEHARKWLKEQAGDLRFLPQIPNSFVRDFGNEWTEKVNQVMAGGMHVQDLTGGASPGSILVRPEFSNTLIRNVEEHGKFRQNALLWPMGSDTVHIPRRKSGMSVYWEGEAEAGTETDPNFQLLGMTAKKMLALHQHSSEVSEDAAISLADIILFEWALAIATEEDRIGFNGDGAGGNDPGFAGFIGVLGAAANATAATADSTHVPHLVTGAAGNDLTTEITLAKLREMTGRLHTWARDAKWYMHRSVHADCDGIETTGGGPVVRYQDGKTASALGYPIEDVEGMPASPSSASTKVLALGNLRRSFILGDRRAVNIETSEHYAFNTDQLTMRLTARIAFLMHGGEGMVVYKTGTA